MDKRAHAEFPHTFKQTQWTDDYNVSLNDFVDWMVETKKNDDDDKQPTTNEIVLF